MDIKVVKLNADYGNNVKGDICSLQAHVADELIGKTLKAKGEDGSVRTIPGAVFMEKETKAHGEWLKKQIELRDAETRQYQAAQIAALAASAQKR